MKKFYLRVLRMLSGVSLASLGMFFCIQANVGLAPWDAFTIGITNVVPITVGTASILVAASALTIAALYKEKLGWSAVTNTFLVGLLLDLFFWIDFFPPCQNTWVGILVLLVGLTMIAMGNFLYIGAGFGCGSRDGLCMALSKNVIHLSAGATRVIADISVLTIGWLLHAKIGLGTLISALYFGAVMQMLFKLFRFEPKNMVHESFADTFRILREIHGSKKNDGSPEPSTEFPPNEGAHPHLFEQSQLPEGAQAPETAHCEEELV